MPLRFNSGEIQGRRLRKVKKNLFASCLNRSVYLLLRLPKTFILFFMESFQLPQRLPGIQAEKKKTWKAIVSSVQSAIVLYKRHFLAPLRPGCHIWDLLHGSREIRFRGKTSFYYTNDKRNKIKLHLNALIKEPIYTLPDIRRTISSTFFGFRPKS